MVRSCLQATADNSTLRFTFGRQWREELGCIGGVYCWRIYERHFLEEGLNFLFSILVFKMPTQSLRYLCSTTHIRHERLA
jgi:hypothetical protein